MTLWIAILIALLAFGGSFIQRVTGFGFGIFVMTALPFIMPTFGEATAVSGLLAIVCALIPAITHFKYVPWKKLAIILPVFLIVSYFSVRLLNHIDGHSIKRLLGVVLLLVSIYFFYASGRIHMKPNVAVQASMGTLSGLMGGLFAMQGPPAIIYFTSATDSKEEYIAVSQWYFLIGNAIMTLFRAGNGFVTPCTGWALAAGAPAVLLGLVLGERINRKMPIATMRRCVYAYMAVSGILAIIL